MNARIPAALALALTLWLPLPSLAQSDADARLQADITRSLRACAGAHVKAAGRIPLGPLQDPAGPGEWEAWRRHAFASVRLRW